MTNQPRRAEAAAAIPRHKIEILSTTALSPYQRNARTHSDKQIAQIAESIRQFGFVNPIICSSDNEIIAGHGRWLAAKRLDLGEVPVVRIDHLSQSEIRAYRIAENRLAEHAGWDLELLGIEFRELDTLCVDFDLEITGFESAEIDNFLLGTDPLIGEPSLPDTPNDGVPITALGDIWQMGDHRLVCGDARSAEAYQSLMKDELADCVFTDPPYNVAIAGNVCGSGKIQHREFAMASGEMSSDEFSLFLGGTLGLMVKASKSGAIHFVCMDWRHQDELLRAGRQVYSDLTNVVVWVKSNAGMGSFYRSQHELIYVFKNGNTGHTNNVKLGQYGRSRSNVWQYAGVNSFGSDRDNLALHPTVKPVALVADAIRDVTKKGDIVLDGFGGSGSTLIAAEQVRRKARLIEIDPIYCDVICERFRKLTGKSAVHEVSGASFEELKLRRSEGAPEPE